MSCQHVFLSLLVVISPCHSSLSPLVVTLTGEPKMGKILSCWASERPSRDVKARPVSADFGSFPGPARSLTVELRQSCPMTVPLGQAIRRGTRLHRRGARLGVPACGSIALLGRHLLGRTWPHPLPAVVVHSTLNTQNSALTSPPLPPETVNFRAQSSTPLSKALSEKGIRKGVVRR